MERVVRIFDSFEAADRADLEEWLALDGSARLAIGEAMRQEVFGVGACRGFEAFFALLNEKRVRYLVIGGVAYNFHAPPRATKDIDVWVEPDPGNLERLVEAIGSFGFPTGGLDACSLAESDKILMLGRVPNRIDILTRPAGLVWNEAWSRRVTASYGRTPVAILGLDDLIRAKRAAARVRDLADAVTLEEVARRSRER